jgi:hypothetical protein
MHQKRAKTAELELGPVSLVGDDTLDIFIKWMHMGAAAGLAVPFVLLVAVDALKPDDFIVFEVPGLTYSAVPGTVGYLCFTKTRAGNAKFFEWFITKIAIPAVSDTRSFHKLKSRAFVSCDGEAIVLEQVFSPKVCNLLIEKKH